MVTTETETSQELVSFTFRAPRYVREGVDHFVELHSSGSRSAAVRTLLERGFSNPDALQRYVELSAVEQESGVAMLEVVSNARAGKPLSAAQWASVARMAKEGYGHGASVQSHVPGASVVLALRLFATIRTLARTGNVDVAPALDWSYACNLTPLGLETEAPFESELEQLQATVPAVVPVSRADWVYRVLERILLAVALGDEPTVPGDQLNAILAEASGLLKAAIAGLRLSSTDGMPAILECPDAASESFQPPVLERSGGVTAWTQKSSDAGWCVNVTLAQKLSFEIPSLVDAVALATGLAAISDAPILGGGVRIEPASAGSSGFRLYVGDVMAIVSEADLVDLEKALRQMLKAPTICRLLDAESWRHGTL